MKKQWIPVMTLAFALSAITVSAQDPDQPRPPRGPKFQQGEGGPDGPREDGQGPRRGPRPEGQPQEGQRPPVPPIIAALDANNDGVIDEKEISNASKALKKLDKNGDGKITMEELRPPRPANFQGGNAGPDGPRHLRGARGDFQPNDGGDRPARRGPPPGDQ